MRYQKILITGGCGFLGQHLVTNLLKEFPRLKIKILDLKANPRPLYDFSGNPNIEILLNKDICDYDSIKNDFRGVDAIIHLAGIVSFSLKDRKLLEKVNVNGTSNLLKTALKNKIKLFLHISSVAALGYGDNRDKPINETFNFDWEIAKSKKKFYMLTKHLADVEVEKARKKGLKVAVVYPGLMFGPGDLANTSKLIKAIKSRKIPVNMPGGTNIADVRDIARGITSVLKKGINDGNFLLSGYNLTFKEVNKTIAHVLDVRPPRITLPKSKILNSLMFKLMLFIESKAKNKIDLTADNIDSAFKFRYFDNSKARKKLMWKPEIKFSQTIEDTIKWMNTNGHFEG
ncbi:NAD-dependent epimerase/dehydratase family protein [Candidatus Woesearchaeota archaeon]|nr:NAD-dependent epimerase/dehydratase family protein [Candidatus Woesearchaeota archaeon]